MIGPNNTSLLHKLGLKSAHELSDRGVSSHRSKGSGEENNSALDGTSAIGCWQRMMNQLLSRVGRPRTKSRVKKQPLETLEGYGLKPEHLRVLRKGGKPDWQLILELQGAGIYDAKTHI